jgi:ABC-2 type transport system ATP-binding protein
VGLAIATDGLTKRYPRQRGLADLLARKRTAETMALTNVTLTVGEGEVFGLLGPNGSGKTTCLKLLSTILLPSEGSATVFGHDIRRDARAVRRIVALVSGEERSLYWRLTARQNLDFFGRLYGLDGSEIRRKTSDLLEVFDLTAAADVRLAEYSTGMRQKLAIARGLLTSPRLLFLDEPTRGLDPVAAHQLLRVIRDRAVEHFRNTVVLTTHIAREVEQLCRRIAILDKGTIAYEGTVDNLRASLAGRDRYVLSVERLSAQTLEALRARMGPEGCRLLPGDNETTELELAFGRTDVTLADVLRLLIVNDTGIVQCTKREPSFEELLRAVFNRRMAQHELKSTATAAESAVAHVKCSS